MDGVKFKVTPLGWTKKNGVTTINAKLTSNNVFTSDYEFNFTISYDKYEILNSQWKDNKDSIARRAALKWLSSIEYHLPEYLVY